MAPPQALVAAPLAVKRRRVPGAPIPPGKSVSTLGDKVRAWLDRQRRDRLSPATERALSDDLGIHHSTVGSWIKDGRRPRSDIVGRLALIMGVPQEWLTDDTKPATPIPIRAGVDDLLRDLSPSEKAAVRASLRDPKIVAALIAYGRGNA